MNSAREGLRGRVEGFLPNLRLGLDIGQSVGGIAVVRRNQIVHAETYVDYHDTTLKERRRLRRGRRTRRAKKVRLARLRSWILRQQVNGTKLPDPYDLMRRKRFQCLPGEYRVGRNMLKGRTGREKAQLTSWVEAVKCGRASDPESFVIALTHLFQKRGFRWEGSDLREMSDDELKEELARVHLTANLGDEIRREVERRKRDPEPGYEGKIAGFEELLNAALTRPKLPRTPQHRSVIEDELRAVVRAFCQARRPEAERDWARQLVRLLNRPFRHARFENRVLSGCSWCGVATPRKSRPGIREKAFRAALKNLRAEEINAKRPLSENELDYFRDLWASRTAGAGVSRNALDRKLLSLRCQTGMAAQLSELLYSAAPQGRTNLCQRHLEAQSQGAFLCNRHRAICLPVDGENHQVLERLERVGPARRSAPNPCREAHDARLIRRIESVLFEAQGRPRFGSAPSLITIEFPKPHTAQTYSCPHCNEKLAVDLRVRYRLKGLRLQPQKPKSEAYVFACPACGALPLTVSGKRPITIKGQPRSIPVQLKNTDAFLRRAKGGLKEKKKRMLLAETRDCCIYCRNSIELRTMEVDHIFPRPGGPGIDTNLVAVCHACNHPDTGKGHNTPWQWRGRQDASWWERFSQDVSRLPLPLRKRAVLLSKEDSFPENPSALARAGSRPRQFIELLKQMLVRHGVSQEQIADNYEHGKIVMQTIDGWMTSRLRKSWQAHPDGCQNFPPKDDRDLFNHAQDAALIAACPPHTWRERIFSFGKYEDEAPPELAPDWKGFMQDRVVPIVRPLGNYRVRWKRGFADETFCQDPSRDDDKRIIQYVPLRSLPYSGTGPTKKRHPSETFIVNPSLDQKFRQVAETLGLKKKQFIPEAELAKHFPGIRHVKVSKSKGGPRLVVVKPKDGPPRKIQPKSATEAVVFWLPAGAPLEKLQISVRWPAILQKFGVPQHAPRIDDDATILEIWERRKAIWLDEATEHSPGFYLVKEFTDSKVTVLPENAITDAVAERLGLRKARPEETTPGESEASEPAAPDSVEIDLGKRHLIAYFRALRAGAEHGRGRGPGAET